MLTTDQELDNCYPNIGNISNSNSRAIGILIVLNDVRAEVSSWIDNADITADSVEVLGDRGSADRRRGDEHGHGVRRLVQRRRHGAGDQRPDRDERRPLEGARLDRPTARIDVDRQRRRRGARHLRDRRDRPDRDVLRRPRGQHRARVQHDRLGRRRTSSSTSIDAILGDSLISSALYPNAQAETFAWISNIDVTPAATCQHRGLRRASRSTRRSRTPPTPTASALYGANGMAVGGIIAIEQGPERRVSAWFEDGARHRRTAPSTCTAEDAAGIFSNVKMVSSSVTSNDGGVGVLQSEINNFVPFQYLNTEGLRAPKFGERVRIAAGLDRGGLHDRRRRRRTSATGPRVQVADDYGTYRLTSKSGKRLLITGDNVLREDGYGTGGVVGGVYRYLGSNGRVDLGAEDYGVTGALGEARRRARRALPVRRHAARVTLDLGNVDYTTADWQQVGGVEGAVYQWMGPDVDPLVGIDLSTQNYLDLRYWKRVLDDEPAPVRASTSRTRTRPSVGWIVVYNDVRSNVEAAIRRRDRHAPRPSTSRRS